MKFRSSASRKHAEHCSSPFTSVLSRLRELRDDRDWQALTQRRNEVHKRERLEAARKKISLYPAGILDVDAEPPRNSGNNRRLFVIVVLLILIAILISEIVA